ncbi:hypothetical protein C8R46DRAFT_1067718, partial [Mycena filopes]
MRLRWKRFKLRTSCLVLVRCVRSLLTASLADFNLEPDPRRGVLVNLGSVQFQCMQTAVRSFNEFDGCSTQPELYGQRCGLARSVERVRATP